MQQKMPKQETMTQAHIRKAQGAFLLAHRMGLIEDPSMEGLKARRKKHNEELRRMEQEGQRFYGPHYFSAPAYLQYELTRLKLDFVQPCEKVREGGFCPDFTEQEKRKDFQTAKAAVAAAPDIREELTAPIKARIQNGTYGVDNASFAEKLLQKQEEMR